MPTLLAALALIAIPVLIHLFNRTRYRRVDWAAMEFLLAAFKKTRKRVQIEHLLLLLLRILAMLFLAFAFFPDGVRGFTTGVMDTLGINLASDGDGGKARHLVMVLDDSASMHLKDVSSDRSSFDRAIELATSRIGELRENRDRVTLIRTSSVQYRGEGQLSDDENARRLNREIPVLDIDKALTFVSQAQSGFGTGGLLTALQEAQRRLDNIESEKETPALVVISDFQRDEWAFADPEHPENAAFSAIMAEIDGLLALPGSLALLDAGVRVSNNRGITDIEVEVPVVGVNIPTSIRVSVINSSNGAQAGAEVKLQYRIDGGEAIDFDRPVTVAVGSTVTVSQAIGVFETPGSHTVEVSIMGKDAFEADDRRILALRVVDQTPVLIINGDPSEDGYNDEARLLARALGIRRGEGEEASRVAPFNVRVIPTRHISTTPLDDFAVVIVANLDRPDEEFVRALEEYVRENGGSVLFTLGDKVSIDDWNTRLWKDGKGLLPARLESAGSIDTQGSNANLRRMVVRDASPQSPLAFFDRPEYRLLLEEEAGLKNWIVVKTPQDLELVALGDPTSQLPTRVSLVVNDTNPDPILLDRAEGRGRSMLFTSTADGLWHEYWTTPNLPVLFLFQEVGRWLAVGDQLRRNLSVGEHFQRLVREEEQTSRGNTVVSPAGVEDRPSEFTLHDGRKRLVYTATAKPGIYRLNFLNQVNGEDIADPTKVELFTVSLPTGESDVRRLGGSAEEAGSPADVLVQSLGGLASYQFIAGNSEAGATQASLMPADFMDIWLFWVGLGLICLLAEMLLSIWFGRKAE